MPFPQGYGKPFATVVITNLDINHDLYASAIRKNQDHPIFMALEVSVCEPQNYV